MNEKLVTAGGRVFSVAATGPTLDIAIATAYKGVESIQFSNRFYRKDIGLKCITMLNSRRNNTVVSSMLF